MARAVVSRLLHEPDAAAEGQRRRATTRTATSRRCASCSGSTRRPGARRASSQGAEVTPLAPRRRSRSAVIRLGTRGSALALAQARLRGRTRSATTSSSSRSRPRATASRRAAAAEDKSRFVKEIEEALLAGEVDLAVHSAKDVPGRAARRAWRSSAVPERADPRDALCGARVARRRCPRARGWAPRACAGARSCWRCGPDLDVRELRGNVDTRLRKLAEGDYDAIVLAAAGLARLGRAAEGAPVRPPSSCCRPPARAASRSRRAPTTRALASSPRRSPTGPRSWRLLRRARARAARSTPTCHTPVGAHATRRDERPRADRLRGPARRQRTGSATRSRATRAEPAALGARAGRAAAGRRRRASCSPRRSSAPS